MTETTRFRKPHWRDPRLAVGVLLIAASVAAGSWLFARADTTTPVYRALDTIVVGTPIADAAMEIVHVNLGDAAPTYLRPGDPAAGVFSRPVWAGELVPTSVLVDVSALNLRPLAVTTSTAAVIAPGATVDLWVATSDGTGREDTDPELIAGGLAVSAVEEDTSVFASKGGLLVHLLVPDEDVGRVLAALGPRSTVTLVPLLGG